MNMLFFYSINQHEIYSCSSKPFKNIFNLTGLIQLKFTLTCKNNNFNDVVLLLAVFKLLLNKKPTFQIINFHLQQKIIVYSSFSKLKSIIFINNFIFNFLFFNQQKITFINSLNSFLFTSFDIFSFDFFGRFYKFVFDIPKIHFSLKINNIYNINEKFVAQLLRFPILK